MEAAVKLLALVSAEQPLEPAGYQKVFLHAARREVCPALPRRLSEVDPALLDLFGKLCNGKAPWPLFLFGDVGGGKTMAALCLADVARFKYASLDDIADWTMANRWFGSDVAGCRLIVDEIGARQRNGDLHYSCLKRALDDAEFEHNRVGVYISNGTPAELVDLFDSRVVSRLTAGTVFKLEGRDRRRG